MMQCCNVCIFIIITCMVFPEVVRASEILTQAKVPLLRKKILIQILNGVRLIKYLLKKKKKKD